MVIDNQMKRAQDSSVYPRGHGLKNSAQVRQLEQKILNHAATPFLKGYLAEAISQNRGLRAPGELKALSAKMQESHDNLNRDQKIEAAHIISDATDAVTGNHSDEAGLPLDVVRLGRFEKLVDAATTSNGVTGNAQKFDLDLYDQVTANIRSKMGVLDADSNKQFDDIVAKYRARLTPEINLGP